MYSTAVQLLGIWQLAQLSTIVEAAGLSLSIHAPTSLLHSLCPSVHAYSIGSSS